MNEAHFFPEGRERRLWILAGLYVGAIYGSAYFVRFVAARLRDQGVLGPVVAGVGLAALAGAVVAWSDRGIDPLEWLLLLPGGAIYWVLWTSLERFEERIHLVDPCPEDDHCFGWRIAIATVPVRIHTGNGGG